MKSKRSFGLGLLLLLLVGVLWVRPTSQETPFTPPSSTSEAASFSNTSPSSTPLPTSTTGPEQRYRRTILPAQGETLTTLRSRLVAADATLLGWGDGGYDVLVTTSGIEQLEAGGSRTTPTPLPITPQLRAALHQQDEVEATLVFSSPAEAQRQQQRFGGVCLRDALTFRASSAELLTLLESSTTILAGDLVLTARPCNDGTRSETFLDVDNVQLNTTWLTGQGEVVAVLDSGCSVGLKTWETKAHPDLKNQVLALSPQPWNGNPGTCVDISKHGTHVCGTIVSTGANSGEGKNYRGIAPGAKLFFQNTSTDGSGSCNLVFQVLDCSFEDAYQGGARIHSNSWSFELIKGQPSYYSLISWAIDRYTWSRQDFLPVIAAGNSGTISNGFHTPETIYNSLVSAKNALAVGALNSSTPYSLATLSSCGPLMDNRIKPDLVVPGIAIMSTNLHGSGTEYYREDSGSSMAAPQVSGACALIRQYCREVLGIEYPTSPLVRALLLSGCSTIYEADTPPNSYEGFGLLSVSRALTPTTGRPQVETFHYDSLTTHRIPFTVAQPGAVRATLVWQDYPAPIYTTSAAIVNDLDLRIVDATGATIAELNDHTNLTERLDCVLEAGDYTLEVSPYCVPFEPAEGIEAAAVVLHYPQAKPTPYIAHTPLTQMAPDTEQTLEAKVLWSTVTTPTLELQNEDGTFVEQTNLTLPARSAGSTLTYQLRAGNLIDGPYTVRVGNTVELTAFIKDENDTTLRRQHLTVLAGDTLTLSWEDLFFNSTDTLLVPKRINDQPCLRTYVSNAWTLSDGQTGSGSTATITLPETDEPLTLTWSAKRLDDEVAPSQLFKLSFGTDAASTRRYTWVPAKGQFVLPVHSSRASAWEDQAGVSYPRGSVIQVNSDMTFTTITAGSTDRDGDGYTDLEEVADFTDWVDAEDVPQRPTLTIHGLPVSTPVPELMVPYPLAFQASDNSGRYMVLVQQRALGTSAWVQTDLFDIGEDAYLAPRFPSTEYQIGIADPLGNPNRTKPLPDHCVWSDIYLLRKFSGYRFRLK